MTNVFEELAKMAKKLSLTENGKQFAKLPEGVQMKIMELVVRMRVIGNETKNFTKGEKEIIGVVLQAAIETMYVPLK